MKKLATIVFSFFMLCVFVGKAQQQLPERLPFFKEKNKTVAAIPLSSFLVDSISVTDLVDQLLGPGAVISNLTYTGSGFALGAFVDPLSSIGLDSGVVISTGNVMHIPGPNVSASTTTILGTPGDSMLDALTGMYQTWDASIIEFDVLVQTDTLTCTFVLGSEEYPEFSPSNFNDVFAFFVSGPGISGMVNIALIPGTQDIISINNINPTNYPQYYIDNDSGLELEYDGFTVPFVCHYPVQNGQTYHFKLALADCADPNFDTGIFLKKSSVLGYASMPVPSFNASVSGMTVQFTNTTNYAIYYVWDFGDGTLDTTSGMTVSHTYATAGVYNIKMEAHNYYQVATCYQSLSVGGVGIGETVQGVPQMTLSPASRDLYSVNLGVPTMAELRVFDLSGQEKLACHNAGSAAISVNLNGFPKGVYLLQVRTPAAVKTWKISR